MKWFNYLLVVTILLFATLTGYSQNHSDYLDIAKKHIQSDNIEKAEAAYNIYKELTGKVDSDVENLLLESKEEIFHIVEEMPGFPGGSKVFTSISERMSVTQLLHWKMVFKAVYICPLSLKKMEESLT